MTRFKDFGSGNGITEQEPLSFKLYDQEFFCKPSLQGKVLLDLVKKSGGEDGAAAAEVISEFFDKVLLADSLAPFNTLLESDKIVTVETLSEIISWLIEEYTSRPNQQPEV
jgi:hypothetical protein